MSFRSVSLINIFAELSEYLLLAENACSLLPFLAKYLHAEAFYTYEHVECKYWSTANAETFRSLCVKVRLIDVIVSWKSSAGVDFERWFVKSLYPE
jgi:hypothetical protein